jgi:hypothetical protein
MRLRKYWFLAGIAVLLGCESKLETGYKYTPLNASDATRRAYYAAPFSPDAQGREQDGSVPISLRRPDVR